VDPNVCVPGPVEAGHQLIRVQTADAGTGYQKNAGPRVQRFDGRSNIAEDIVTNQNVISPSAIDIYMNIFQYSTPSMPPF